jgi:hypothetical protein
MVQFYAGVYGIDTVSTIPPMEDSDQIRGGIQFLGEDPRSLGAATQEPPRTWSAHHCGRCFSTFVVLLGSADPRRIENFWRTSCS